MPCPRRRNPVRDRRAIKEDGLRTRRTRRTRRDRTPLGQADFERRHAIPQRQVNHVFPLSRGNARDQRVRVLRELRRPADTQPVPASVVGARVKVQPARRDRRNVDTGQRFVGQRPPRMNRRRRRREPYHHSSRIAAQIPHFGPDHALGPRRQTVVRRFEVAKSQPLDSQPLGIVPLQFRQRPPDFGQEAVRCRVTARTVDDS